MRATEMTIRSMAFAPYRQKQKRRDAPSSNPLLPASHHPDLFGSMRGWFAAAWHSLSQLRDFLEHIFVSGESMPLQETADDGAGAADSSQAMDENRIFVVDGKINELRNAPHGPDRGRRSIEDRKPNTINFNVALASELLQVTAVTSS